MSLERGKVIPEWEKVKAQLELQEHEEIYELFYQTQVMLAQGKKKEAEIVFQRLDNEFNFAQFEEVGEHRDKLDAITGLVRPAIIRY